VGVNRHACVVWRCVLRGSFDSDVVLGGWQGSVGINEHACTVWVGYTLDYNFEMGFQHLFSSNRGLIAESYYPIILEYARRRGGIEAADTANGACNATGGLKGLPGAVHFTIQLAPGGLANSGDLGIHSNALFAGLHFISKFEASQNTTFLTEESYPLLRAVAGRHPRLTAFSTLLLTG
jgi:hypothetical protein